MPDIEMSGMEDSSQDGSITNSVSDSGKGNKALIKKKTRKRGIIYLSTIPPYMNVAKIREIFSEFGEVGRIYLQPSAKPGEKRKRVPNQFTEGWVEFQKKKIAKLVATKLNNTKIGTRKKSRYYDMIWNIKYIPRFKWIHLSERLAYERAALKQRLRAEISQAKKEAHYLQTNVEKSKKMKKNKTVESTIKTTLS
ncbi:pre-rRNA-processing protein esf2-like [Spodoptera litura]|uniref:Activator of basal transcription 1 n=1 Tax=Spodoptera litura TaxID=69820 RepID=A0A9J7DZF1_SPOLT|nr:pre-rRNA-processing protein esf2-like [Spodoptera litura]